MPYRPLRTNAHLAGSVLRACRCPPPSDLRPYLLEFYQYEVPAGTPHVPVQIFPSGVPVLRFDLHADQIDAALYGPSLSAHMRGLFFRHVPIFGLAIKPTHATHLTGMAISELRDLRVQLEVLWPRDVARLKEQLADAPDFPTRVALTSVFVRRILRPQGPTPSLLNAFEQLVGARGKALCERACADAASSRTLRRQFARHTGLSPKEIARVVRFQALLRRLAAHSTVNLAQLAVEHGFSDQAHMTREFSRLLGIAPGRFRASLTRLHEPALEHWAALDPQQAARPEPRVRRLDRARTVVVL